MTARTGANIPIPHSAPQARAQIPFRKTRFPLGALGAVLTIFLGACAAQNGGGASATDASDADSNVIAIVQPDGDGAKDVKASPNARGAQTAARVVRIKELVGMKGDELTALLGKPSLVRTDRQAQVWQYRAGICVLDLYLYPPKNKTAADDRAVVYIESRGKDAKKFPGDACVSEVISARHGAS